VSKDIRFGEHVARFLGAKKNKNGIEIETYAVDFAAQLGATIFQAELFKGIAQTKWSAWEGPSWRHRATLKALESARNDS